MRIAAPDGAFVEVTFLRRTWPDATDFWDGNWITVTVRASSHGIHCTLDTQLRVDELRSLIARLAELHRTLTGQLEFWPMEPNLKLTFQMGKGGWLTVFVELQPDLADPARMTFELCVDQTYILDMIAELAADLERFPQVGHS
jgi:hypothetical protein